MSSASVRLRVDFGPGCSLGPGKIALLEAIARSGSLSAGARALKMSYRRAWLLLHDINGAFAEPAVKLSVGGKSGGGAELTPFGLRLVAIYRDFESATQEQCLEAFRGIIAVPPAGEDVSSPRRLQRSVTEPAARKRGGE
jgi:molybdate transport system regulatory protein